MAAALRRAWLFVLAYLCLLRVHALLRRHTLMEVYRLSIRPWKLDSRELDPAEPLVAEMEWAVNRAALWQWQRTVCLPRSIAMYHLLQVHGARPRLIVGVTSQPFASHAWVELAGTPVGDGGMAGRHYHYRPILRLPADAAPARKGNAALAS